MLVEDADDIAEAIVEPREDIVDGFPEKLMPDDYGQRRSRAEVSDLAAFVAAASGGEAEDGEREEAEGSGRDSSGRGRGRGESSGRGRSGDDG